MYIKAYICMCTYMSACSHLLCTTQKIRGNTYVCRILDKLKSAKKDLKTYLFQLVFAHSRHSRTFIEVALIAGFGKIGKIWTFFHTRRYKNHPVQFQYTYWPARTYVENKFSWFCMVSTTKIHTQKILVINVLVLFLRTKYIPYHIC